MSSRQAAVIARRILVAGLLALVIGLWMSRPQDGPLRVICGGEEMGPGDVCISTEESVAGSYEERLQRQRESAEWNEANGPAVAGIGVILVLGSVLILIVVAAGRSWGGRATSTPSSSDAQWWNERSGS
jgi:hypothetical protein